MGSQNSQNWTNEQSVYLDWLATPKSLREPKTRTELADKLGINRRTLGNWSKLDGFKEEKLQRMFEYFAADTADIIVSLRNKALDGDVRAIEVWLSRVEQIAETLNVKMEEPLLVKLVREIKEEKEDERQADPEKKPEEGGK